MRSFPPFVQQTVKPLYFIPQVFFLEEKLHDSSSKLGAHHTAVEISREASVHVNLTVTPPHGIQHTLPPLFFLASAARWSPLHLSAPLGQGSANEVSVWLFRRCAGAVCGPRRRCFELAAERLSLHKFLHTYTRHQSPAAVRSDAVCQRFYHLSGTC